jgi:hypothetical protein
LPTLSAIGINPWRRILYLRLLAAGKSPKHTPIADILACLSH